MFLAKKAAKTTKTTNRIPDFVIRIYRKTISTKFPLLVFTDNISFFFLHNGICLITPFDKPHYYFGLTASPIFDREIDHISINNGTLKKPGLNEAALLN